MNASDPGVAGARLATGGSTALPRRAGLGIALCALVAMLDGLDMQAMAIVAPLIMREWGVGAAGFGVVLSAAPLGMILGAVVIGPLGDRTGRRPPILLSLVVLGGATALVSAAQTLPHLVLLRALAGIAMGGIVPNAITLATELAPPRARSFAAAVVFGGVPFGGALSAAMALWLLDDLGWRTLFFLWGGLPLLLVIPLLFWLPESPEHGQAGAERVKGETGLASILAVHSWWRTALLWLGLMMAFQATYFFAFWMPTLLETAGLGQRTALASVIFLNGGAIPGTLVLGWLMTKRAPHLVVPVCYVAAALCAWATALAGQAGALLAVLVFLVGFLTFGGQVATAALVAAVYPSQHRGAGLGWATAMGRIGAVTGPVLGGLLVGAGFGLGATLSVVALAQLGVAALLRAGGRPSRAH